MFDLVPDQKSNPGLLHWEHRILATGPSGTYVSVILNLTDELFLLVLAACVHPVSTSPWSHLWAKCCPGKEEYNIGERTHVPAPLPTGRL